MAAPWAHGAELTVVGRLHGSITNNVWHLATNDATFDNPNALNDALVALAEAMLECFVNTFLPAATQDWQLLSVDVRPIHPVVGDAVTVAAPAASFGGSDPTSVSFAALLVNLRTGGGGRSGRGKKFLPPPGEPNMQASTIDAGTLVQIGLFLACVAGKFLGANPSTPWRLGVFSPTKAAAAVGGGFDNAFRVVTSMTPSTTTAIISSRKLGSGS
jgi:hypothetical protein